MSLALPTSTWFRPLPYSLARLTIAPSRWSRLPVRLEDPLKIGRNDRCPCGSDKKYKNCCLDATVVAFTTADRLAALDWLSTYCNDNFEDEHDAAYDELRSDTVDSADVAEALWLEVDKIYDNWFYFERNLDEGGIVVDHAKPRLHELSAGARKYIDGMRHTAQRLYTVADKRPGATMTLRDVLTGDKVVVHERMGSQTIARGTWLLARVGPKGATGMPEIEPGVVEVPQLWQRAYSDTVGQYLEDGEGFDEKLLPRERAAALTYFLLAKWVDLACNPPMPQLSNTDGEPVLWTCTHFEVVDRDRVAAALDGRPDIDAQDQADGEWGWLGPDKGNGPISLGVLRMDGDKAVLETNSAARGERGRAMLVQCCGNALAYRATTHEDMTAAMAQNKGKPGAGAGRVQDDPLDKHAEFALVEDTYARHYRSWLDEPVPAIGGMTPRAAAKVPARRTALVGLMEGLRHAYERALTRGEPTYDPTWMWAELNVADPAAPEGPPPLAHDRWNRACRKLLETAITVAERVRREPGRDRPDGAIELEEIQDDLSARRFIAEHAKGPYADSVTLWLATAACLEFGRRKVFSIVPDLAFMLAQTDLTARGDEVRAPFPFFALVFTDRGTLALAERWLVERHDPTLAGQMLYVLTVFVAERTVAEGRELWLGFAPDALGAAPPPVIEHTLVLRDGEALALGSAEALRIRVGDEQRLVAVVLPLPGLLHRVVSAILYATSADAESRPTRRAAKRQGTSESTELLPLPAALPASVLDEEPNRNGQTFHLPGTIDISRVRTMQELERAPGGKGLLHRFLVRGHWRRANVGWADQRMRWIAPYWKGPDLADVVERAYRLKP